MKVSGSLVVVSISKEILASTFKIEAGRTGGSRLLRESVTPKQTALCHSSQNCNIDTSLHLGA
jgi:hypothetical protein